MLSLKKAEQLTEIRLILTGCSVCLCVCLWRENYSTIPGTRNGNRTHCLSLPWKTARSPQRSTGQYLSTLVPPGWSLSGAFGIAHCSLDRLTLYLLFVKYFIER